MGDVVITYYGIEGIRHPVDGIVYLIQGILIDIVVRIRLLKFIIGITEIHLLIILLGVLPAIFVHQLIQQDVVLGLCIGYVAQMGNHQIVIVEGVLQHLPHASGVRRQMTVGANQEGIFV